MMLQQYLEYFQDQKVRQHIQIQQHIPSKFKTNLETRKKESLSPKCQENKMKQWEKNDSLNLMFE